MRINHFEFLGRRRTVPPCEVAQATDMVRAERHLARVRDKMLQDYLLNAR